MEFRAFQMSGEEGGGVAGMPPQQRQPVRRRGTLARVGVAATVTFIALAAVLYLHPEVRAHYRKWWDGLRDWIKSPGTSHRTTAAAAAEVEDRTAVLAERPRFGSPTPLPQPTPGRRIPLATTTTTTWESVLEKAAVAPATTAPSSTTKPSAARKLPEVTLSPGRGVESRGPATRPAKSVVSSAAPDDEAARVQISPPPSDSQTADRRAWELYERAIKSEQRGDYAAAVKEYQWIEQLRLPEGLGPLDVESRLARARKLMLERENASTTGHE
jgi:hypothetical protein